MTSTQEFPTNLEEQLALGDAQLAIMGISRSLADASARYDSAVHHLRFVNGYTPTHPGSQPHPEAGGMDHEDWKVARLEYDQYDSDDEIYSAAETVEEAEYALDGIYDDKKRVEVGDEEVVSKYAAAERERIQKELEEQRLRQESADRWAKHEAGTEIDGSVQVKEEIEKLFNTTNFEGLVGKKSSQGWVFKGGRSFEKLIRVDGSDTEESRYENELLYISSGDDVEVQFSEVSNVDHEGVRRYGKNIATVNFYRFTIRADGNVVVSYPTHKDAPVDKWLPHFMDNGTIKPNINLGHPITQAESYPTMASEDMAKIQAKISEVAEAMKELDESR